MSIFEAIMVLCFACSWPFNIYKSIKSRSTRGKSLLFLVIVWFGYVAGVIHKILYARDWVMALYCANLTMVSIDSILYFINLKRDRAEKE